MVFSALYCQAESSPSGYLRLVNKQAILPWIWKNIFQEFAKRRKKTHINFLSFLTLIWRFEGQPQAATSSFGDEEKFGYFATEGTKLITGRNASGAVVPVKRKSRRVHPKLFARRQIFVTHLREVCFLWV